MKSFLIFALVVSIIYAIYYAVIIVQDLYGKPKDDKAKAESFDVTDLTDDEESVTVNESDGGFMVGDNTFETPYEELPQYERQEAPSGEEDHLSVLEKVKSKIEDKMEDVNPAFSDEEDADELIRTIMAKGIRPDGRVKVKVQSFKNEI